MEIIGNVAPSEVPKAPPRPGRPGIWPALAARAIEDHKQGRVTMIRLADLREYKTMLNNMSPKLRVAGYWLRPVKIEQDNALLVYLALELRQNGTS